MPVNPHVLKAGAQIGAVALKGVLEQYVFKKSVDKESTTAAVKNLHPTLEQINWAFSELLKNQRIANTNAAEAINRALDICRDGLRVAKTKQEREQVYDHMMELVEVAKKLEHRQMRFNAGAIAALTAVALAAIGAYVATRSPSAAQGLLQTALKMIPKKFV